MIAVDGSYHCVVEYLDAHLGGSQIKDIVPGDPEAQPATPTHLVFCDGHTLPILCPDCGENYLTAYQIKHGYHCDSCTRNADPEGWAHEVRFGDSPDY